MQRRAFLISLTLPLTLALTLNASAGAKEKVLYRFTGGADGGFGTSSLIMDAGGNLYGATGWGGNLQGCGGYGCGVIFELTRTGNGKWQETVLHSFQDVPDGANPEGNLVFDAAGNLYGTTSVGGTTGGGTVFELSHNSDGTWTETVLYDFQDGPDGSRPAGLTFHTSGKLYGTTPYGGSGGRGTVYELSPPEGQETGWTEKILFDFPSASFAIPNPGVIFDGQGNLYGTYYDLDLQFCDQGCGAVFKLRHAHGQWTETDLYDFLGGGNGGQPPAGVIRDSKGNLYGTGSEGGNNFGMVFQLKRSGNQWKESMLHNFCSRNNCADGAFPSAGLVMDRNGALYGTTRWGGTGCRLCGVVFKLSRTRNAWKETVLHSFQAGSDGVEPQEGLILDGRGNIYGTADSPYGNGAGIVFEVTQ